MILSFLRSLLSNLGRSKTSWHLCDGLLNIGSLKYSNTQAVLPSAKFPPPFPKTQLDCMCSWVHAQISLTHDAEQAPLNHGT